MRDAGRRAGRAIENFREEPHGQQPVRGHLESVEAVKEQPAHLDFCRGESHEERAHQPGNGSRRADRRRHASHVHHGVHLQRQHARNYIKRRIDQPPPGVLEDRAREPQEPHVADQVQPAAMQEIRGDQAQARRVRRNERILGEERSRVQFLVSGRRASPSRLVWLPDARPPSCAFRASQASCTSLF